MKLRSHCNLLTGKEASLTLFKFSEKAPVCCAPVSYYASHVSLPGQLQKGAVPGAGCPWGAGRKGMKRGCPRGWIWSCAICGEIWITVVVGFGWLGFFSTRNWDFFSKVLIWTYMLWYLSAVLTMSCCFLYMSKRKHSSAEDYFFWFPFALTLLSEPRDLTWANAILISFLYYFPFSQPGQPKVLEWLRQNEVSCYVLLLSVCFRERDRHTKGTWTVRSIVKYSLVRMEVSWRMNSTQSVSEQSKCPHSRETARSRVQEGLRYLYGANSWRYSPKYWKRTSG